MTLRTTIRPALVAIGALLLPSCEWDGHFTVLGYTTRPNYDTSIHTVYVPIFKNSTLWRGMEFEVTEAVIREIQQKTPYRVVSDCSVADTELTGNIINLTKNRLNITQLNEVREAETVLTVEVVWRDRRLPMPPDVLAWLLTLTFWTVAVITADLFSRQRRCRRFGPQWFIRSMSSHC